MRDVDIRDYIGYSEELTAEQVRKLEPGAKVIRHNFDRQGVHQTLEMTVVQSGKKKMLSAVDWYRGTTTLQPIRKETERMCYTRRGE